MRNPVKQRGGGGKKDKRFHDTKATVTMATI